MHDHALTPERLAELRRLAEAAREEPWAWQGRNDDVADLPSVVLTRLRATRTPCTWGSCIARDPDKDGALVLSEHACQACSLAWYRWHGRSEASNPAARYLNALSPSAVLALLDRLEAAEARVEEALGISAMFWLGLQATWDLHKLRTVPVVAGEPESPAQLLQAHAQRLATDPQIEATCAEIDRRLAAGEPLDDLLGPGVTAEEFRRQYLDDAEGEPESTSAAEPSSEADQLARLFHETYERLAPTFGYETRKASAVPWDDVPDQNKRLMVAVASEVLREFRRSGSASADTQEAP